MRFFLPYPRHIILSVALVLGLLFLPMVSEVAPTVEDGLFTAITLPGLNLSKYKVISLSILLGVLLRDGKRLDRYGCRYWTCP